MTTDTLFGGAVTCHQYESGYRFSVDAILLAHFMDVVQGDKIADFGTGCGVIPLILSYRWNNISFYVLGLEIQPSLVRLAQMNVSHNKASHKIQIVEGDVRNLNRIIEPESYDKIVCNPPYYPLATGRVSGVSQAAIARHQINGGLQHFIEGAAFAVKNRGTVYFVYPAERLTELLYESARYRLEPCVMQTIYSYPGSRSARLILIKLRKNGGRQLDILPPFYIYDRKDGTFSEQMQKMYDE